MDKHAADVTLMETASQLNSRTNELMKNRQVTAQLASSLQAVGSIKDTADRLSREAENQWSELVSKRHADTLNHLRREQEHFRYILADNNNQVCYHLYILLYFYCNYYCFL